MTDAPHSIDSSSANPVPSTEPPVDRADVRDRLDNVMDPELDQSIVQLQYVDSIDIDSGSVTVTFVLPTAWCSPAFAWMMATGIRDEVSGIAGVSSVTVQLVDHMHSDEITTGVNQNLDFESVFEDADDGIETTRRKLDEKSRFARQYRAIQTLQASGFESGQIASMRRRDVELEFRPNLAVITTHDDALGVTVPREPLAEYLAMATATGLVTDEADLLFADRDGTPLPSSPEPFEAVLRDARLAAATIEGQASICASLHESRNSVELE